MKRQISFKNLESMCKTRGFHFKKNRALRAFMVDPQQHNIAPMYYKNREREKAAQFIRETKTHPLAEALQDIRMMVAYQKGPLTEMDKRVLSHCNKIL